MSGRERHVAVVGAGITGLSAAHYLREMGRERGWPIRITLIEAGNRIGGKIRTLRRDGCVIEQGPDSFLARKTPIITLTRELGLIDQLVPVNPAAPARILHRGVLHPMPKGMQLGIPARIGPFLASRLISWPGKARALLDAVLPAGQGDGDESLGAFLGRRLGREVVERIAEPLLAGIYAGHLDELSLLATFPQFRTLEKEHGSLIRGMAKARKKQQDARQAGSADSIQGSADEPLPPHLGGAVFLTYRNGLSTLTEALLARLADARLIFEEPVIQVDGHEGKVRIRLACGDRLCIDAAVITVPNGQAADMLASLGAATEKIRIPYASVANVVLGFRLSQTAGRKDTGSGFVVPVNEGLAITACTVTSVKWPHIAPEDWLLVRCYVGREGDLRGVTWSDDELIRAVRRDLQRTLGLAAAPVFAEITRWPQAMPQYRVGHVENIAAFRETLKARMPGVAVAGAGFAGIGLPDCIAQGRQAAEEIMAHLARQEELAHETQR